MWIIGGQQCNSITIISLNIGITNSKGCCFSVLFTFLASVSLTSPVCFFTFFFHFWAFLQCKWSFLASYKWRVPFLQLRQLQITSCQLYSSCQPLQLECPIYTNSFDLIVLFWFYICVQNWKSSLKENNTSLHGFATYIKTLKHLPL